MVQPVQTQTPTLPRFGANFGFVLRVALQSLGKCSTELLPCFARVETEVWWWVRGDQPALMLPEAGG